MSGLGAEAIGLTPASKQRFVRVIASLWALAVHAPCLARSFDPPPVVLCTVSDAPISPPGTRSARNLPFELVGGTRSRTAVRIGAHSCLPGGAEQDRGSSFVRRRGRCE
jgi:hypothetical protein